MRGFNLNAEWLDTDSYAGSMYPDPSNFCLLLYSMANAHNRIAQALQPLPDSMAYRLVLLT